MAPGSKRGTCSNPGRSLSVVAVYSPFGVSDARSMVGVFIREAPEQGASANNPEYYLLLLFRAVCHNIRGRYFSSIHSAENVPHSRNKCVELQKLWQIGHTQCNKLHTRRASSRIAVTAGNGLLFKDGLNSERPDHAHVLLSAGTIHGHTTHDSCHRHILRKRSRIGSPQRSEIHANPWRGSVRQL